MKEITITTQAEFDALPDKFDEFTKICITAGDIISVRRARENSSVLAQGHSSVEVWENSFVVAQGHSSVVAQGHSFVVAQGHSSVVARGNSSVRSRENSSVEAWGKSSVESWGKSSVEAWENSSVEARGNSSVEAHGNSSVVAQGHSFVVAQGHSSVVAWENSSVEARGNSSVEARGNSSVEARGNSSVEAHGNSSVVARENSSVEFFSGKATGIAKHNSIFIITDCDPKIEIRDNSQIVRRGIWRYDIRSFCDCYKSQVSGDFITLFKTVRPDNRKDFHSNTILYEGTVECPDFDPNPNRECGGGLHLSPTPQLALSYNKGLVLECRVAIEDIVIFPGNISKVRCRKVEVVGEL